jgi:hypothetical protein
MKGERRGRGDGKPFLFPLPPFHAIINKRYYRLESKYYIAVENLIKKKKISKVAFSPFLVLSLFRPYRARKVERFVNCVTN